MFGSFVVLASGSIDVDATLLFQALIFAATYFAMGAIVKDYLRARDARAEGVVGSREEADEFAARADQLDSEYEEKMVQARRDAAGVREALRTEQLDTQTEELSALRNELDATISQERQKVADAVDNALEAIDAQKVALAELIYNQVVPKGGKEAAQ